MSTRIPNAKYEQMQETQKRLKSSQEYGKDAFCHRYCLSLLLILSCARPQTKCHAEYNGKGTRNYLTWILLTISP